MQTVSKAGFPFLGVMFLVLAVFNFVRGEHWVVWAIAGVLLGGLSIFRARKGTEGEP